MPIATCIVPPGPAIDADALRAAWARGAGIGTEEMTVTVVRAEAQAGRTYAALVWLHVPSLWSDADVDTLQRELARATIAVAGVDPADVQVLTAIVPSGRVVAAGEVARW